MVCSNCGRDQAEGARFCSACGAALAATAGVAGLHPGKPKKRMSGCAIALIAVAVAGVLAIPILGIVAAVAIPNLLNAIDRGKQKRTMADLRTIGTAIEEYSIDNNHYPTAMNLEALQGLVSPEYTGFVPPADGWAHPFLVESQPEAYRIYSLGKDGVRDGCGDGKTATFEADICFENGQFTQWPEGSQR